MSRRVLGVIGSAATVALLAAAVQTPAQASEPADQVDPAPSASKLDDRPRPRCRRAAGAATRRRWSSSSTGDREVESRGGSTAVKVAPGQWAQYGLRSSDNIFTTRLVEFGDQKDPRFATAPTGPQHNQIPQPNRAVDNTTYWLPDFGRQHYLDMFFDAEGESLRASTGSCPVAVYGRR